MKNIVHFVFFGNLFYGICAVALAIESSLQNHISLHSPFFYGLIFLCTILFYTQVYYTGVATTDVNQRVMWYRHHLRVIKAVLTCLYFIVSGCIIYMVYTVWQGLLALHSFHWVILLAFPVVAFLYSTNKMHIVAITQLRRFGWLKPFFIGFVWTGLVAVYPVVLGNLRQGNVVDVAKLPVGLYWLQNFLFIAALAVIFDIKDKDNDALTGLKTYPNLLGNRNTIICIIIPLALLGAATLFLYLHLVHFSGAGIVLQMLPFIAIIATTAMVVQVPGIMFYLVVVDGLMLLKAVCGIVSCLYFNKTI